MHAEGPDGVGRAFHLPLRGELLRLGVAFAVHLLQHGAHVDYRNAAAVALEEQFLRRQRLAHWRLVAQARFGGGGDFLEGVDLRMDELDAAADLRQRQHGRPQPLALVGGLALRRGSLLLRGPAPASPLRSAPFPRPSGRPAPVPIHGPDRGVFPAPPPTPALPLQLASRRVRRRRRFRSLGGLLLDRGRRRGRHRRRMVRPRPPPRRRGSGQDDADDVGHDIEKRVEAERNLALGAAASDHGSISGQWSVVSGQPARSLHRNASRRPSACLAGHWPLTTDHSSNVP